MIGIEQIQRPRDLILHDYRFKGLRSTEYTASWGVFVVAVATVLYGLGLTALVILHYILPSPASHAWVNHQFHLLYGFTMNAAVLLIALIVVKWWQIPFGMPLVGLALVELVVGYALMFAMPHHQWIPAVTVVVATRIAFAIMLRRGLLEDAK